MKSFLKFFTSVKLAIVLLIIIIIASILGTFIPQQRSFEEYIARYGQLAPLFSRLQLVNLYHSLWYIALLFLFALNIIICTLNRLLPKFQRTFLPKLDFETKNILALKTKERFRKNSPLSLTQEEIKEELRSRHYHLRERKKEVKVFLLARKRVIGWFGADLVHLGLLIILAGGIVSGLGGFRKDLVLNEGQTVSVPRADFSIRLNKFETEYYPDGNIKDWKSTLTVLKNASELLRKSIEVNHPLSYQGFVFYQSGYGSDWENTRLEILARKKGDPSFLEKLELKVGERARLQDAGLQVSVLQFIPDFMINEKKEAISRSNEPNNPAAFIQGYQGNEKIFSGWIFAKFPDFARLHQAKENEFSFELKKFEASQYSVIQVARDPGVNLIWCGCAFLMIGLFLAFYWPTREIKIILAADQGKTEVIAGGASAKSWEAFQEEFEEIVTSLRRAK